MLYGMAGEMSRFATRKNTGKAWSLRARSQEEEGEVAAGGSIVSPSP